LTKINRVTAILFLVLTGCYHPRGNPEDYVLLEKDNSSFVHLEYREKTEEDIEAEKKYNRVQELLNSFRDALDDYILERNNKSTDLSAVEFYRVYSDFLSKNPGLKDEIKVPNSLETILMDEFRAQDKNLNQNDVYELIEIVLNYNCPEYAVNKALNQHYAASFVNK
jgi:hypothetical protein